MKKLKTAVHWLLLVIIILYIITGFGITEFRIVESLTFGLLTKPLSFKIHTSLIIPLIVLLVLHVYLKFKRKRN